jgi:hypothetical protein
MDHHLEEAATGGKTAQVVRQANADREIPMRETVHTESEPSETGSTVEYPWERTAARPPTRQTSASADGNAQLLPTRAAEEEVFEMRKGPQGQRALVRRDAEIVGERDIGSQGLTELEWPDFDEDG